MIDPTKDSLVIVFLLSLTLYVAPASDLSQAALDQSGKFTMTQDFEDAQFDAEQDAAQ